MIVVHYIHILNHYFQKVLIRMFTRIFFLITLLVMDFHTFSFFHRFRISLFSKINAQEHVFRFKSRYECFFLLLREFSFSMEDV